ncbi:hypothetical protein EJF36_18810 [Bacillus sp. HMF5848]|uniref:molybdopterin-containing oxidoreductase family protein n=1 Tax=Bacillus sp. HMF5848 TaxID=2495421 RepID=UPI000F78AD83|nr:molybdopterin-dependent oxidoreductase [Bacillus sp. HMF5848]RSK28758.1 hypothetical protein EJF36_18810 [Bacillus sp. HMF5848]
MNDFTTKTFKHVCPLSCPSSCTMSSYVENNQLLHIAGDCDHPYTNGKLCAKGFSFVHKNRHLDRLKYPYYQKEKGSGNFKQITWERAFEIIASNLIDIYELSDNFLPLALLKGSGNKGIHHFVTDEFFSCIGETIGIISSTNVTTDYDLADYKTGFNTLINPSDIRFSSVIIIWGANPAATNIHLVPFLLEAKAKNAKIIVIDPIYTQTAELANLYIQIKPGTDGALANVLTKAIIDIGGVDFDFLERYSYGFDQFLGALKEIDSKQFIQACGIDTKTFDLLLSWCKSAKAISHIIGFGLIKHINSKNTIRTIEALAAVRGDFHKKGGGMLLRQNDALIFNNQLVGVNRNVTMNQLLSLNMESEIKMLWIACANPMIQNPNTSIVEQLLRDIPFVVTVDQFLTETAKMSNLILPTTTHFEEMDVVVNAWHHVMTVNEKAVPPYFESKSEWHIMKELAQKLNKYQNDLCSFPIHSSEEEYLNAQFNDKVYSRYKVRSIEDLKGKLMTLNVQKDTKGCKYHFCRGKDNSENTNSPPIYVAGKSPTTDYPFWLISSHHPYMLNSQFHYLRLSDKEYSLVEINSEVAKKLKIFNGEVIRVFNNQAKIEIKAVHSDRVPANVLLLCDGTFSNSSDNVNQLVPLIESDSNEYGVFPFYDTFVNIEKW